MVPNKQSSFINFQPLNQLHWLMKDGNEMKMTCIFPSLALFNGALSIEVPDRMIPQREESLTAAGLLHKLCIIIVQIHAHIFI